ncbi:uncharacterized protein RCC_07132 [Ramularia collo-cygni]|uniref:Zn(2)-C6 fungal-type domain-containing protein n=1 Tax=Ramularia collo-cygni TaxID=112498 RepID=A0A2D3VH61_9PEZI|nr:uncharacterized protein RCC_07132 [Ramularia collo-cygni]CZT21269.1 uncharacterized protein RCC_07132 [Ramularia collo-cygni]
MSGIGYPCSACGACFKRKDLLDRHHHIHDTERPTPASSRSGKACDRCSRLKTKCDGLATCARCQRGGHCCTYKTGRARAGRLSAGTISPVHSPYLSTSEGGSPGSNLSYSVSDPGDHISYDQSWTTEETWSQLPAFTQASHWDWPSSLDGFSGLDSPHLEPLQPQQLSPSLWNHSLPGDASDCFQFPQDSFICQDDVFDGSMTASWPQYESPEDQIDPALIGDIKFNVEDYDYATMEAPYAFTPYSLP